MPQTSRRNMYETLRNTAQRRQTWIGLFPSGERRPLQPLEVALLVELDTPRQVRNHERIDLLRKAIIARWRASTTSLTPRLYSDLGALLGGNILVEADGQPARLAAQPALDDEIELDTAVAVLAQFIQRSQNLAPARALPLARDMVKLLLRNYRRAGMPYGNHAAGLARWLNEQN